MSQQESHAAEHALSFHEQELWSLAKKMQQQVRASLYALFSVNNFL